MTKKSFKRKNQLKLGLTGFRRKPVVKKLIGKTKKFNGFFKLGKRIIAEERTKHEINFYELDSQGKPFSEKIGSASLMPFDLPASNIKAVSRIKGKKTGMINYMLLDKYRNIKFLGKGIGNQLVNSLEELAKEKGIQIVFGLVREDNLASVNLFLNRGFKKLRKTNIFYKEIK
ncbi:MAG: hypothetical protein COT90_00420 [Candidatus Diapherotrites archaeon CG10_big_fil_rev_8_21_14_0_10_31_34]|nr:MAG: hypothetical protein COT90_00420 [Candidatus Diapherotrites archaeon CG10_big_fil_rev_8_21_14_0_10_31_34]